MVLLETLVDGNIFHVNLFIMDMKNLVIKLILFLYNLQNTQKNKQLQFQLYLLLKEQEYLLMIKKYL